jgi:hypothetical protein
MNTRETTSAIFAIRHWQTVNTSEYLFQFPPDYFLFIGLAIAPLVIMYLCYRCGLVQGDQIAKSKSPSLSRNSP